MWCPSPKHPHQALAVLVQVSRRYGTGISEVPLCAGVGKGRRLLIFQAGGSYKVSHATGRRQKTKEQTESFTRFMGNIIHKGNQIEPA